MNTVEIIVMALNIWTGIMMTIVFVRSIKEQR
jgi:hypothetical protein